MKWVASLSEIDVNELDLENMGSWPPVIKVIFAAVLSILVCVLSYYLFVDSKIDELAKAKNTEVELRQSYRSKYAAAANLDLYKQQMQDMEQSFSSLLKQLPTTHETPGLLDDITYVGTSSGLVFLRINW